MQPVQAADPDRDLDPASPIRLDANEVVSLADVEPHDAADLVLTCINCGARMTERKCKLVCRCGYFLSCSDYY
jgi:hypothetical protein